MDCMTFSWGKVSVYIMIIIWSMPVKKKRSEMSTRNLADSLDVKHLFDIDIHFGPDTQPAVSAEDREGEFVGTQVGTLEGDRIRGTLILDSYVVDCAYLLVSAGAKPGADQHLCKTNPVGVIETDDGAKIWLDGRGYGFRGPDPTKPHMWRLTNCHSIRHGRRAIPVAEHDPRRNGR